LVDILQIVNDYNEHYSHTVHSVTPSRHSVTLQLLSISQEHVVDDL